MEEPLKTLVVGMIAGGLMGMVFIGHLALLLVHNPPEALKRRAVESSVTKLVTITTLVTYLTWNVIAIFMAFAAQALLSGDDPKISIAPSPAYLFVVIFVALFLAIPAMIFFRDRKNHLFGELALFIGIFGFLIPNMVVAVQYG
jgi:magnesium-transporting ATPase (P-type)